jgi:hypothetical protein
LWTTKYAPTNLKEVCGNKTNVERLGNWLKESPHPRQTLMSGTRTTSVDSKNQAKMEWEFIELSWFPDLLVLERPPQHT